MNYNTTTLPLYTFFESLRKHHFELGIDDYTLLLNAIQGGFGLESKESLLRICKTLWLKSREHEELFEILFENGFHTEKQRLAHQVQRNDNKESPATKIEESVLQNPKENETTTKKKKPSNEGATNRPQKSESINIHEEYLTLSIQEVRSEAETFQSQHINPFQHKFQLQGEYCPLPENELKQNWRFLRRTEQGQLTETLDIPATIRKITQKGVLVEPVFLPFHKNVFELIILIDHKGSMVAFHQLSERLAKTSSKDEHIKTTVYYFFNIPGEYVYKNSAHTQSDPFNKILQKLIERDSALLIISDGGAARGTYNPERVELTKTYISRILPITHRIAWINPMPQHRWENTSASYISDFVPMFETTTTGLRQAINVLRGKLKVKRVC
jgi:uncharacterized protein